MLVVNYILYVILIAFCIVAASKDAKTTKIPNWIPLALFIIWFFSIILKWVLISMGIIDAQVIDVLWTAAKQVLTSALICCLLAACIVLTNKIREKKRQKKTSPFGMGDVKLLMVVCLFLGPMLSCINILSACIAFLIYVLILSVIAKIQISKAPFAPFILIGVIVSSLIAIL